VRRTAQSPVWAAPVHASARELAEQEADWLTGGAGQVRIFQIFFLFLFLIFPSLLSFDETHP